MNSQIHFHLTGWTGPVNIGFIWTLFQNPLTTPFWPFLPKVLNEAKRQEIVTVKPLDKIHAFL
jgi:hypothetical protein